MGIGREDGPLTDYLEPDAFPFTAAELRAAVALFMPPDTREEFVRHVSELCATRDPEKINDWVLVLPDELYATLALLDAATNERVEALWARWWSESRRSRTTTLMFEAGRHPRDTPTPEVVALLEQEEARRRESWEAIKARVAAQAGLSAPDSGGT